MNFSPAHWRIKPIAAVVAALALAAGTYWHRATRVVVENPSGDSVTIYPAEFSPKRLWMSEPAGRSAFRRTSVRCC